MMFPTERPLRRRTSDGSVITVIRVTSTSLTNQAWPLVPSRAIKGTVNSQKQTEEINLIERGTNGSVQ